MMACGRATMPRVARRSRFGSDDDRAPRSLLPSRAQIVIFINALAMPNVAWVTVNGSSVLFVEEADSNRAWIRLLNLHLAGTQYATVRVGLTKQVPLADLCTARAATSVLCEYQLRGAMDTGPLGSDTYKCCPHGYTSAITMGCPA